ncbi:hypothetical protein COLO4_11100 [Corchorus olitorius]|uniref:Protein kinase domain-containing protein n=1 Tax=Corchorus olitorius TaxID=93759 RepID=A0A1R3K5R8_9ROSI|nr:hypothetical protein COLO4_11100 [Corchorus olitorius]
MEKQSKSIQKSSWTRGKCLGKGAFGTVSLAINQSDGAVFAVKSVELATCLPNQLESLENEIRILRSLSSPYVVRYLGDDVTRYESPTTSYRNLHMEYLPGGTVVDTAIVKRRLTDVDEKILRWQTRCLVSALRYVHGEGIVHCDVKGKNVLVGHDSASVKLADFGSSIEGGRSVGDRCRPLITPRGSPLWMAPEVMRGEYQGPESDVWSLGCTVIEMVTGKPAWEDQGFNSVTRIANSDELPELPTQLSELAPNMIGESSPRCVLDFGSSDFEDDEITENFEASARQRIGKLATEGGALWESDGWVAVRSYSRESGVNSEEGTSSVYSVSERTDLEFSNCLEWQCSNNEDMEGLEESSGGHRCGGWRCESDRSCSAGSSCRKQSLKRKT